MNEYRTKLTADTSQHDNALRRSASQVYQYEKQVSKAKGQIGDFVKGGLGKLIPALGLAGGALGVFNKALKENDILGDKVAVAMAGAAGAIDGFVRSLTTGTLDTFNRKLHDIVETAKQTARELDNYGTASTVNDYELRWRESRINELRAKKASQGSITAEEENEVKRLTGEIRDIARSMATGANKVQQAILDEFRALMSAPISRDKLFKYIIGAGNGTIDWEAQMKKYAPTERAVTSDDSDVIIWEKFFAGGPNQKAQYEFWKTIGSILDTDKFKQLFDYANAGLTWMDRASQIERRAGSMTRGGGGGKKTAAATYPADFPDKDLFLQWQMLPSIGNAVEDFVPQIADVTDATERWETSLEAVLDTANRLYPTMSENLTNVAGILGTLSGAVGDLGSAFDSTAMSATAIMGQAIATMLKGYATATAEAAELGPLAWAGFAAGGIAQVAAVIAQMKSLGAFANGGIVGGNTTIGDYNLARVNKGEMILNEREQTHLWQILNGLAVGGSTGTGEVVFRISGSDLVGTLNNHNRKAGRAQ